MYHDSDGSPWILDKEWEDLSPKEWIEVHFYNTLTSLFIHFYVLFLLGKIPI